MGLQLSSVVSGGGGGGGGSGTVTSVSVVTANGVSGSVANATTTPAITISTTITGILSGNGTAISAASTTGSGSVVLATSPTLVTPTLGVASATSINKVALTAPATSATLTIADGKTLTASNTLTFTGTDSSSVAFGAGGTVTYTSNNLSVFAATTSAQLAGVISDETGSGALVFGTSPVFTTDITLPNTGLHILDTNATHDLIIAPGSNLTADRTLTVITGDAAVNLDLTAVTDEYVLAYDTGTNTWRGVAGGGGGGGDVSGPASSVDNSIVRFDGITGKIIQGYTSGAPIISDTGAITATQGGSLTGTWSDLGTVQNIVIEGGSIDGTTIGTSVRSSAEFTSLTTENGGLQLLDATDSFPLIVTPASTLTANRTLNITTGDANVNLDLTAVTDEYVLAYDTGTNTWRGVAGGGGGGASTALDNLASVAINAALVLGTSDAFALGSATKQWSDLFLAEGGVINWDNGDVTITQTGNVLSFAGASTRYEFDANLTPTSSDGAALGTTALMFSDLFLASGAVINFNNGNLTLTHSAGDLALAGGTLTLPNTGLHILDTNASHDLIIAPGSNITADRTLTLTTGDANRTLTINSDATVSSNTAIQTITFIIDGGGATITSGVKGDLEIPFGCTINAVTLLADQSGSIVVDIWKDTYANYPPTVADTITASAKPTISSATKSQDTTLTGWTTSITAGDTLRFNVDSITTCQRVTLSLKVTKT